MSNEEGGGAGGPWGKGDPLVEHHQRMLDGAARRLARLLDAYGCPMPRAELALLAGVEHWSMANLDEAIAVAERRGLLKALPLGWVAPAPHLGARERRHARRAQTAEAPAETTAASGG